MILVYNPNFIQTAYEISFKEKHKVHYSNSVFFWVYCCTVEWRYSDEIFRLVIKRFKLLLRCLGFDNKDSHEEWRRSDKLSPIRELFNISVSNYCKNGYSLSESQ